MTQKSQTALLVLLIACGAHATTYIVDSAQEQPYDFITITAALTNPALASGDVIQVRVGTGPYEESLVIEPPAGTPASFELTLEGIYEPIVETKPTIMRVDHVSHLQGSADEVLFQEATVEIHNQAPRLCNDFRVTIDGFEILGEYEEDPVDLYSPGAIGVFNKTDDADLEYETRITIRNNILVADKAFVATLAIGAKRPALLEDMSVIWGDIHNNDIYNSSPDRGDAISAHHFVGNITNNRLKSDSEGIHLGYGKLDEERYQQHQDSPAFSAGYITTSIVHNAFFFCWDESIHFTHGSKGEVRNNIIIAPSLQTSNGGAVLWPFWNNERVGIFVGASELGTDDCGADTLDCMSPDLLPVLGRTEVTILNNNVDRCFNALKLNREAILTLHNNILCRVEGPNAVAFVTSPSGANPFRLFSGYNLFWSNDGHNYDPASLHETSDLIDEHPHFEGYQSVDEYSYMLRDDVTVCYAPHAPESLVIDRGHPNYLDPNENRVALPPAHGEDIGDIGAYGGPLAIWSADDACTEYKGLP